MLGAEGAIALVRAVAVSGDRDTVAATIWLLRWLVPDARARQHLAALAASAEPAARIAAEVLHSLGPLPDAPPRPKPSFTRRQRRDASAIARRVRAADAATFRQVLSTVR